tara:strand:- start:1482 stop:1769 length:288 start_codon:yes stop_codon:yes gene_type:complete
LTPSSCAPEADDELDWGGVETFDLVLQGQRLRISRRCPHRAGRLDYGVVNADKRTVTCPLHFSVFSLDTGEQLSGSPCGRIQISRLDDPIAIFKP